MFEKQIQSWTLISFRRKIVHRFESNNNDVRVSPGKKIFLNMKWTNAYHSAVSSFACGSLICNCTTCGVVEEIFCNWMCAIQKIDVCRHSTNWYNGDQIRSRRPKVFLSLSLSFVSPWLCGAPEWTVNRRQNRHHHLSSQRFVIIESNLHLHNLKSKININVNGKWSTLYTNMCS